MGSTIRTKVINGQEYLYEITYYYDPVTKRTRQRSRYLGKSIDGKPVRVRDAARTPRSTFAYGDYLPLLAVIDALRLDALLSEHFPQAEAQMLLTLALNRVPPSQIEPGEGTSAHLCPDNPSLGYWHLRVDGSSDLPLNFCRSFTRSQDSGMLSHAYLAFLLTDSISLFERNYNPDSPKCSRSAFLQSTGRAFPAGVYREHRRCLRPQPYDHGVGRDGIQETALVRTVISQTSMPCWHHPMSCPPTDDDDEGEKQLMQPQATVGHRITLPLRGRRFCRDQTRRG